MRLLVVLLVLALSGTASIRSAFAQPVKVSDEARAEFRKGVAALKHAEGPQYEEAYLHFQDAYAISPSPKILGNIGLCAMKLERDGEAIDAYEKYLATGSSVSFKEKLAIKRDLKTLHKRAATLVLSVSPDVVTVFDRRLLADAPPVVNKYDVTAGQIALRLHHGKHKISFEAPDHEPSELKITLEAAAEVSHDVVLAPLASDEPPAVVPVVDDPPDVVDDEGGVPVGVWIGLGLTGAFGIGWGVVGGLALSNKSAHDDAVAAGDDAEAADLRDEGEPLNIAGDVLFGATAVAVVVTTVFLILWAVEDGDDELALSPSGVGVRF